MKSSFEHQMQGLDAELRVLDRWSTPSPSAASVAATRRAVEFEVRRARFHAAQRWLAGGAIAAAAVWLFALTPRIAPSTGASSYLTFDADLDAWAAAFDQSRVALGARLSGYEPTEWESEGSWYDELELFYDDDESEDAS